MAPSINVHASDRGIFDTVSGKSIDILKPDPESIIIEDIAHGLAHVCRFGGQITPYYSVAQHSILVARLAPSGYELEGLLHDASEAYLGDMIKPLKNVVGRAYEDIEERFMRVICYRFGLDYSRMEMIKGADKEALELEDRFLRKNDCKGFFNVNSTLGLPPYAMSDSAAKSEFLKWFDIFYG